MERKEYQTQLGKITYWTNTFNPLKKSLVFLPGLTADHTLFDQQIDYFSPSYNVFVWDASGHAQSRPFTLDFTLKDKAIWLHEILEKESIISPILIGQSMGGYVSQMFLELYPNEVHGFISIDSAPLQKKYLTNIEIFFLKHVELMYKLYPWKLLIESGSKGVSTTSYGQNLMRNMIEIYSDEPSYYCALTGHGFRILAQAIELDLPYAIHCTTLLICGKEDQAGFTKRYNRAWARNTGIPIHWIEKAGHNSNTDRPDIVNKIILDFMEKDQ